MTDCARFARWLDDGMPAAAAPAHEAHAAACPACAAALADARALDRALERALAAAPEGFAERVMARVERARRARLAVWAAPEALPWWARALTEPATVFATTLAALVLWQYPLLARLASSAWGVLTGSAVSGLLRFPDAPAELPGLTAFADPYVMAGLALAGLPLAWWLGLAIYHWSGDATPGPRSAARSPVRR